MRLFLIIFLLLLRAVPDISLAAIISRFANNLGLVAYWHLDEAAGTRATDVSGNKNHGTINGNPSWVGGQHGRFRGKMDELHMYSLALTPVEIKQLYKSRTIA